MIYVRRVFRAPLLGKVGRAFVPTVCVDVVDDAEPSYEYYKGSRWLLTQSVQLPLEWSTLLPNRDNLYVYDEEG